MRRPETKIKKCTIQGCNGVYESKHIAITYRKEDLEVVINDIPADVCSICGDTLLSIDVSEQILETPIKSFSSFPGHFHNLLFFGALPSVLRDVL